MIEYSLMRTKAAKNAALRNKFETRCKYASDLSAEKKAAQEGSWFPSEDEDQERKECTGSQASKGQKKAVGVMPQRLGS